MVYPMPLALKGIAGKRDELRPVIAAQGCPVDVDTRGPELPQCQQEGVTIIVGSGRGGA